MLDDVPDLRPQGFDAVIGDAGNANAVGGSQDGCSPGPAVQRGSGGWHRDRARAGLLASAGQGRVHDFDHEVGALDLASMRAMPCCSILVRAVAQAGGVDQPQGQAIRNISSIVSQRVVPAVALTMARSKPSRTLSREDLPHWARRR